MDGTRNLILFPFFVIVINASKYYTHCWTKIAVISLDDYILENYWDKIKLKRKGLQMSFFIIWNYDKFRTKFYAVWNPLLIHRKIIESTYTTKGMKSSFDALKSKIIVQFEEMSHYLYKNINIFWRIFELSYSIMDQPKFSYKTIILKFFWCSNII